MQRFLQRAISSSAGILVVSCSRAMELTPGGDAWHGRRNPRTGRARPSSFQIPPGHEHYDSAQALLERAITAQTEKEAAEAETAQAEKEIAAAPPEPARRRSQCSNGSHEVRSSDWRKNPILFMAPEQMYGYVNDYTRMRTYPNGLRAAGMQVCFPGECRWFPPFAFEGYLVCR
jgi:hypothetical protein